MTREDIIRIAREAGIVVTGEAVWRLCELVAAAEREACAEVCKNEEATLLHKEGLTLPQGNPMLLKMASVAHFCAAAIRARREA